MSSEMVKAFLSKSLRCRVHRGDAVFFSIRAAGLMKLDLGRFQCNKGITDTDVEAADSALILIGPEHPIPEVWITNLCLGSCFFRSIPTA
jgi:hypothetical protein